MYFYHNRLSIKLGFHKTTLICISTMYDPISNINLGIYKPISFVFQHFTPWILFDIRGGCWEWCKLRLWPQPTSYCNYNCIYFQDWLKPTSEHSFIEILGLVKANLINVGPWPLLRKMPYSWVVYICTTLIYNFTNNVIHSSSNKSGLSYGHR